MTDHQTTAIEEEEGRDDMDDNNNNNNDAEATEASRKQRRKLAKKEKRKKKRKELAEMARQLEEARLNDPEELRRLQAEEEMEKARIEKERREFEEREKRILEEWQRKKAIEEEIEERRRLAREEEDRLRGNKDGSENDTDEDGWEYVEEGPPEIIWKGNEIIVQKKKVRVKKNMDQQIMKEDPNRPTSNPLPPQSEAFSSYRNGNIPSAQQLLENVASQTPNFGTEQDKDHCPFHHKTGVCQYGSRCKRIHFYPDKSCTLLMKNMYNGPGLAFEQDEGLECTDEEVERAYEEFYEDVHTEFLKFGEIINFKVCKNCSHHLRGNVYVHYKSLDSAVLAYKSLNGRYFAGKQVQCEFVSVTKWRVAICGEFMRSKLKTCSRGVACNFIHCFQNPGGDYEWADWDKPPPRYWVQRMVSLFGYFRESMYENEIESPRSLGHSSRSSTADADRYNHFRRSQSRDIDYSRGSRNHYEDDNQSRGQQRRHRRTMSKTPELDEKHRRDRSSSRSMHHRSDVSTDSETDRDMPERERGRHGSKRRSKLHINGNSESQGRKIDIHETDTDADSSDDEKYHKHVSKRLMKERTRRTQQVGRAHDYNSKDICSVDARHHRKFSKSPDKEDEDRHTCAEKCLAPDISEEFGNDMSKEVHSSRRDEVGDAKHASTERSYRIYGSRSRTFTSKWEQEDSERRYKKEAKRKREAENSDSESPSRYMKGSRSREKTEHQFDEDIEDRGRWEPE